MASDRSTLTTKMKEDGVKDTRGLSRAMKRAGKNTSGAGKSGPGNVSPRAATQSGVGAIMDELDKLQCQQITFSKKIEKERENKDNMELKIREEKMLNYYMSMK